MANSVNAPTAPSSLGGGYTLHPAQVPAITGVRPILHEHLLTRVLAQQKWADVPKTVSTLFSLCGYAQNSVATLAMGLGSTAQLTVADRQELRLATLREHTLHLLLQWQDRSNPSHTALITQCPLRQLADLSSAHQETYERWISEHLLAMPSQEWLARWHEGGLAWLSAWAAQKGSAAARYADARRNLIAHAAPTKVLRLNDLGAVFEQWRAHNAQNGEKVFAQEPSLAGQPLESGTWTRTNSRQGAAHDLTQNAWTRLLARVVDLVELLHDTPATYLHYGRVEVDGQYAYAWIEMARGLLLHCVHWQEDAAISQEQGAQAGRTLKRYGIIAPTEWNLHPQGVLAQMIAQLGLESGSEPISELESSGQALALAQVYDPCVPLHLAS